MSDNPYLGKTRAELTEILQSVGQTGIAAQDQFKEAWDAAEPEPEPVVLPPEPAPVLPQFEYPEYTHLSMQFDIIGQKFTDAWNAERFIDRYQNTVRYCNPIEKYLIWNGLYWKKDDYDEIPRLCHDMIVDLIRDPTAIATPELLKHLTRSISPAGIRGMMFFLQMNRLTVRQEELDTDPDRVNVLNGVLNLSTCTYEPPNRDRYITRMMNVRYDPSADCPLWRKHLSLIFGDDKEAADTIDSFQMICGYSLMRGNPEQVFFILYGLGENGKSVTLNVISRVMGEYAMSADPRTFMFRRSDDTTVRSDIARLYPAHMITAVETGEGVRLNEGLLKAITGHDRIVSRQLYEKEQEQYLEGKVFFATNHEPVLKDSTHGMLRRIIKIPFVKQIPAANRDDQIEKRLIEEASGILNWMLVGLRAWHQNNRKLQLSVAITNATEAFRNSVDEYREFFETDIKITGKDTDTTSKRELFNSFCQWYADRNGEQPKLSMKEFNSVCQSHKINRDRRVKTGYEWVGVKALNAEERKEYEAEKKRVGELVNYGEPYPINSRIIFPNANLLDKVHQGSLVHHSDVNGFSCGSLCGELAREKCHSNPSQCGKGVKI